MIPSGWPRDGGGCRLGSGSVMADGGGSPRCDVDMVLSMVALTRSELTGESTLWLGEARDFGNGRRCENSWVDLPPKSVLGGCEMVSNIDGDEVGVVGVACDSFPAHATARSRCASGRVVV